VTRAIRPGKKSTPLLVPIGKTESQRIWIAYLWDDQIKYCGWYDYEIINGILHVSYGDKKLRFSQKNGRCLTKKGSGERWVCSFNPDKKMEELNKRSKPLSNNRCCHPEEFRHTLSDDYEWCERCGALRCEEVGWPVFRKSWLRPVMRKR
jgi:hypothetical protein